MSVFGIPAGRLVAYLSAAALLILLNVARYAGERAAPAAPLEPAAGNLPELPALAVASDFEEVLSLPARNLFRADTPAPPPPTPQPERAPEAAPAPDPEARSRAETESMLDSFSVIGFLSTSDGVVAVLDLGGSIVNAFKGDRPAPGFIVSDITINSVTMRHLELGLERTYGLDDAD